MEKITKKDIDHLEWMYHRMVSVHNEKRNTDYMMKFIEIINKLKSSEIDNNYDYLD